MQVQAYRTETIVETNLKCLLEGKCAARRTQRHPSCFILYAPQGSLTSWSESFVEHPRQHLKDIKYLASPFLQLFPKIISD